MMQNARSNLAREIGGSNLAQVHY